jgi:hypothetical protein
VRAILLVAALAGISAPAVAQEIDWGKVPPDKALLALILPANMGAYEISDKGTFADFINAPTNETVVKSYTVNPGTYSFVVSGSADPIKVEAPAGSVQVVEYVPGKDIVFSTDFEKAIESLKAGGASNWTWLGQQTFEPAENLIFVSPRPSGTDDPGPMKPKG